MIISRDLIDTVMEIGIAEIEKMNNNKIKYGIDLEYSDTNAIILKNKKQFMKKKKFFKKIDTKMHFRLLYSNMKSEDINLLEKILYIPNGINLQEIEYKYSIPKEVSSFILAMLHELGHIYDMVSDVYDSKFLKRTCINDLEYVAYRYTMSLYKTREEQVKRYKELKREQIADELGMKLFKENLEKFSILVKQLA